MFGLEAYMPASQLGQLLVGLVALAVTIFVTRFVLSIAWRLALLAAFVVAVIYGVSLVPSVEVLTLTAPF